MADVDVNEHGSRREHVEDRVEALRHDFQLVRNEIAKVIVGHEKVVEGLLTCLLCGFVKVFDDIFYYEFH